MTCLMFVFHLRHKYTCMNFCDEKKNQKKKEKYKKINNF